MKSQHERQARQDPERRRRLLENVMSDPPSEPSHSRRKTSASFGPVKQVGVAVSIGFPLLVIGVLTLAVLMISWVGTATFLWILAGVIVAAGVLAAASRRVL
jgi:hypothetical protein